MDSKPPGWELLLHIILVPVDFGNYYFRIWTIQTSFSIINYYIWPWNWAISIWFDGITIIRVHDVIFTPSIFALPYTEIKFDSLSPLFIIFNHQTSVLFIVRAVSRSIFKLAFRIHTSWGSLSSTVLLSMVWYIWDKFEVQLTVIITIVSIYKGMRCLIIILPFQSHYTD